MSVNLGAHTIKMDKSREASKSSAKLAAERSQEPCQEIPPGMFESVFAPAPYNTRFKKDSTMVPFDPCAVSTDWNQDPKTKRGGRGGLHRFVTKAPKNYELKLNDPDLPGLVHAHLKQVFNCGGDSHRTRMIQLHEFFERGKRK